MTSTGSITDKTSSIDSASVLTKPLFIGYNQGLRDPLQEAIFTNMTDKDFKRQLNAFKTYVGLYVSRYDFCKDILKCCKHQTQLSFSDFLSFIDTINIKDLQSLYQRIQYDIKEI
ncbi:hypothetical protein [Streptococcus equi]|nr:hypothetical protein [Streptococcus equi]